MKKYKIGSLFSGIGGFELGIERAIKGAETIWQVETNKYCQSILKKHWPNAKIYDDVRNITKDNVEPVDILIGGFPCQSISVAGKQRGLEDEKKSGLWWEFHRIISELRPKIVVMENVPNIVHVGGLHVLGSLAEIGYDSEWTIISAKQFGACHLRKRWFCVAYPNDNASRERREDKPSDTTCQGGQTTIHEEDCKRGQSTRTKDLRNQRSDNPPNIITNTDTRRENCSIQTRRQESSLQTVRNGNITDANVEQLVTVRYNNCTKRSEETTPARTLDTMDENRRTTTISYAQEREQNYWQENTPQSPLCTVDDGIPDRVARLKALGNAIVPQCSQYIGECILRSGLLDDI